MEYVIATVVVFGLVITMMAVGVIFSNKPIKGSCGGLNVAMGDKDATCQFCGKTAEEAKDCNE